MSIRFRLQRDLGTKPNDDNILHGDFWCVLP